MSKGYSKFHLATEQIFFETVQVNQNDQRLVKSYEDFITNNPDTPRDEDAIYDVEIETIHKKIEAVELANEKLKQIYLDRTQYDIEVPDRFLERADSHSFSYDKDVLLPIISESEKGNIEANFSNPQNESEISSSTSSFEENKVLQTEENPQLNLSEIDLSEKPKPSCMARFFSHFFCHNKVAVKG